MPKKSPKFDNFPTGGVIRGDFGARPPRKLDPSTEAAQSGVFLPPPPKPKLAVPPGMSRPPVSPPPQRRKSARESTPETEAARKRRILGLWGDIMRRGGSETIT